MNNNLKCVEYFFDSKKYSKEEIIENMENEELGFERCKSDLRISLNKYGIYVVKLIYNDDKLSIADNVYLKKVAEQTNLISLEQLNAFKELLKKYNFKNLFKEKNTYHGYETYKSNGKKYGDYTSTKVYNSYVK